MVVSLTPFMPRTSLKAMDMSALLLLSVERRRSTASVTPPVTPNMTPAPVQVLNSGIDRFGLQLFKYYAGLVYHLYKFLRGDDVIGFGYAVVHELLARTFELLRGAGHDGYAYNAP